MTGLDMVGFTIAVAAAMECVAGRIAPMDRRQHRPGVIAAYAAAACVCILAASLTWQGLGSALLDLLSLGIAGHLIITWDEWRHHPPGWAGRGGGYMGGAVPSRIDGGD